MIQKISIKVTAKGISALNDVLQGADRLNPFSREERCAACILQETAHKVYVMRCNFTQNKPKKFTLKYYQASVLEYFLRNIISGLSPSEEQYSYLHKIANELNQALA